MVRLSRKISIACLVMLVGVPMALPLGLSNDLPDLAVYNDQIYLYRTPLDPAPPFFPGPTSVTVDANVYIEGQVNANTVKVSYFRDRNFNGIEEANESIGFVRISPQVWMNPTPVKLSWYDYPADVGSYSICVLVNPLTEPSPIQESNHDNNLACLEFEIKKRYSDFVPTYSLPQSYVSGDVLTYNATDKVYVTMTNTSINMRFGVRNHGTVQADTSFTLWIDSDDAPEFPTGGFETNPLPLDTIVPWVCAWNNLKYHRRCPVPFIFGYVTQINWSTSIPGTYNFSVEVDYYGQVTESNETNNDVTFRIRVEEAPPTLSEAEEGNVSPFIASILAAILIILGILQMERVEKKAGVLGKESGFKQFIVFTIPFIIALITVGLASLSVTFEVLHVPPWTGSGMIVDLTIFALGLLSIGIWMSLKRSSKKEFEE